MVVDDNRAVCDTLAAILRDAGHEVTVAADGVQALERYRFLKPDGIVVDIFMPRMDGVELIRTLRRDFADARIVAISAGWDIGHLYINDALVDRDIFADAARAGANSTLWKPVDPRDLVSTVQEVLAA